MFPFLSIQTIKTPALTLAITLVVYIFLELVKANIRHVAAAKGWDSFFLKIWDAIPEWGHKLLVGWAPIRERWWLWLTLGLSGGLSIAAEVPATPATDIEKAMAPIRAELETTKQQLQVADRALLHPCQRRYRRSIWDR
jgi:hypothetical protein